MKIPKILALSSAFCFLAPQIAWAHPWFNLEAGFAGAFMHPFTGFDHALVMSLIGAQAALLGGRFLFLLPATFVGSMTLGMLLASAGLNIPGAEIAVALSIFAIGAMIFAHRPLAPVSLVAAAAVAGLVHGHVHGSELLGDRNVSAIIGGAIIGTAILHCLGIGVTLALSKMIATQMPSSRGKPQRT
jgi:urease accessory protein